MILNQNGTTEEFNKINANEFIIEGWERIDLNQPTDQERILAIGDLCYSDNKISELNPRRMSLVKYNTNEEEFTIADTEYYYPTLINVMWWKRIEF